MTISEPRPDAATPPGAPPAHGVPFRDAVLVWARIAALSFGGPVGQMAVMHRILVEEKRWIGERRFLHALNFCMLLPGPEAHQLAIYLGWLLHRTWGGIVAGVLFVLPGFLSILALSYVYVAFAGVPLIEGLFFGLRAAVLAIVAQAVVRIGGRTLRNGPMIAIAAAAFVAIFFFGVPFPLIVASAALIGWLGGRAGSPAFAAGGGHAEKPGFDDEGAALGVGTPDHARPNLVWSLKIGGALALLWLAPVAILALALGPDDVFARLGAFFSWMAVVTFGGAYAVLAYVAQAAVETYGWLRPGEMLDGLGMAETTPGPLIMVLQFVGFLAAFRDPGGLDPYVAATLGAILVTWVTFTPSFLWIFVGAPFSERLRGNRALAGALAAITASVVGVILNLALWFALHTLFARHEPWSGLGMRLDLPVLSSLDPAAAVLSLAAIVAVFRFKLGVFPVLAGAAALGAAWRLAAG